jgi:hypothetical protein
MSPSNETAPFVVTSIPAACEAIPEDARFYTRCRNAVLRLSDNLPQAADQGFDYAPFLLEAMNTAMTNLLEHGDERDLLLLEQWLNDETKDDRAV